MLSNKIVLVPGALVFDGTKLFDQTTGHSASVTVSSYHTNDDGKVVPHFPSTTTYGSEMVCIDPLVDYKKFYYGPKYELMTTNLLLADGLISDKVWDHSEFLEFLSDLPFTKHVLVQRQFNSWSFNFGSFSERELMRTAFDQLKKKTTFTLRLPSGEDHDRKTEIVEEVKRWLKENSKEHEVANSGYNQFKISIRDDEISVMFKLTWAHLIAAD